MPRPSNRSRVPSARPGFTIIELLVVIALIGVLIGILIPTIRSMRLSGQEADTRSLLNQIDQACQAYFADFKAYPGPIADSELVPATGGQPAFVYGTPSGGTFGTSKPLNPGTQQITAAENLMLGLAGGLEQGRSTGAPALYFDPNTVGLGPSQLGPTARSRGKMYITDGLKYASKGRLRDVFGVAMNDTVIPEFIDSFTGNGNVSDIAADGSSQSRIGGMPILYLRSRKLGDASKPIANFPLVTDDPAKTNVDYQIQEILPYTASSVGGGRESDSALAPLYFPAGSYDKNLPHGLRTANPNRTIYGDNAIPGVTRQYPYDAYDYLVDPSTYDRTNAGADLAKKRTRKPDSYILISAGRDRIYGTADDITNFGTIGQ